MNMLLFTCLSVCKLILVFNICSIESARSGESDQANCENGTFFSRDYQMCMLCSTCDVYSTMFSPCTASSDTVCIKCADVSEPDLANHIVCKQCPPCQAGEYMQTKCTNNTSTVCRKCPEGSFSKLASYKTNCIPCTSCGNRVMITDCTASLDTHCGGCKKGYFEDANRNRCNRCALCGPGQQPIEECRNGLPGKLCSEYFFFRTQYVEVRPRDKTDTSVTTLALSTTTSSLLSSTTSFFYSTLSTISSSQTEISTSTNGTILFITVIIVVFLILAIITALIYALSVRLRKTSALNNDDSVILYFKDDYDDVHEQVNSQNMNDTR